MGKKRLRPWLEDQIHRRTFPGLKFIDKNKRIFSFPWKDLKKKGVSGNNEATRIVKAWALHSGMYKEGDPENLPLWKARIRTSLTKLTDIKEVKAQHNLNDQTSPYRAYRFISVSDSSRSFITSSNSSSASSTQHNWFDSEMNFCGSVNAGVNIARNHPNIPTVVYEKDKFEVVENMAMGADLSSPQIPGPYITCDASSNLLDLPSLYHQKSLVNINGSASSSDNPSLYHQHSDVLFDSAEWKGNSIISDMSSFDHQQSDVLLNLVELNGSSNASDTTSLHHQQLDMPSDLIDQNGSSNSNALDTISLHHQQLDVPSDLIDQNGSSNSSETISLHHQQLDVPSDLIDQNGSSNAFVKSSLQHQHMVDISSDLANLKEGSSISDMSSLHHDLSGLPSDLASLNRSSLFTFDSKMTENNVSITSSSPNVESSSTLSSANKNTSKIKAYFMEKCILEDFIDVEGARLFCGNLSQHKKAERMTGDQSVYGSMNLKQIHIPDFDSTSEFQSATENKQKRIKELQDGMDRGLILKATESTITAERLCRTCVFIKTQEGKIERLKRKTQSSVFDLGLFIRDLYNHITENGPQPSPSVMFIFGQEYKYKMNKETIFYIKVKHIEAERLLTQAVNNDQDNIDEILLSSKTPSDNLAEFLKKLSL